MCEDILMKGLKDTNNKKKNQNSRGAIPLETFKGHPPHTGIAAYGDEDFACHVDDFGRRALFVLNCGPS